MNYIGIENKKLLKVSKHLNVLLATYSIYYQNLRSFHWYVKGKNFFDMHEQFEELYNDAKIKIDEIAERILTIQQKPLGNMSDYLKHAKIKEAKATVKDEKMVSVVLENHAKIITILRDTIKVASEVGDEGTVDILGGFLSSLEKKSWILDAWNSRVASN